MGKVSQESQLEFTFYETVNLRPERGVLGNSTFSFNQELVNSQLKSAAAKSPAVFLLLGGRMGVCTSILSPVILKTSLGFNVGICAFTQKKSLIIVYSLRLFCFRFCCGSMGLFL